MITSHLMGGLGNYMFQIAVGYSKSIELNKEFYIDLNSINQVHKPIDNYLNNVLRKIKFNSYSECDQIYYEPYFHFSEIPNFSIPTKLYGYFQSEKYFIKHRKNILELFDCPLELKEKLYKKYIDLNNDNTCSIHVRRGDYTSLQEHHPLQSIEYYEKSISKIGDQNLYLIFSDDIEWCKKNLKFIKNKIFCEENEDYEDLYLMSFCKDNINANSSFSWWGSWLNTNNYKKVIFPQKWFGPQLKHYNTESIYTENCIII